MLLRFSGSPLGQFWSIGSDVDAKKERFLQNTNWLHNAQVSFIYQVRQVILEIPNFDHLALASGGWIYMDAAGIAPQQKGNEKLSWETTWTTNLGISFGILRAFQCRFGTLPQAYQ